VIVVCRSGLEDELRTAVATLDALAEHSALPCEKIVALAAPGAGGELTQALGGHHGVRVVSALDGEGMGQALNRAAAQAIGQYLVFVAAGGRLADGWEARYLSPLSLVPCLVGVRWLCLHNGALAQLARETADAFQDWRGLALPRRLFGELGGFDGQFQDVGMAADLCWRARDRGVRLVCVEGGFDGIQRGDGETQRRGDPLGFRQELVRLHRRWPARVVLPPDLQAEVEGTGDAGQGTDGQERDVAHRQPLPHWVRSPHRQRPVRDGERILIHREIGMGDILLALTACQALKDQNPNCQITFSTAERYFALPEHSPCVDRVVTPLQVRAGDYDREIDFDGREKFDFVPGEGHKERLDLIAQIVGYTPKIRRPVYVVTADERRAMAGSLRAWGVAEDAERIGLVLSSASPFRSRSPEASAALVRDLLRDRPKAHIFLIDGNDDRRRRMELPAHPRVTDLCGKQGLTELGALLEQLDLAVTSDTGPMHLAAAFETPQLAFFSEIHPLVRVSHYANVVPKAKAELCVEWPCGYGGKCTTNQQCINAITYEELRSDVARLLRRGLERRALRSRRLTEEVARHSHVTRAKSVLLERHGGLGDVLFALTVAQALKRLNPEVAIDFVTSPEHVEWVRWFSFQNAECGRARGARVRNAEWGPLLREVHTHRPRRFYDLRVDLQDIDVMDGVDRVEVMAAKLGLLSRPAEGSPYLSELGELVELTGVPAALREERARRVEAETARSGSDPALPLLAFAPFCVRRKADRSWPVEHAEAFLSLATEAYRVLLLDSARVHEIPDRPNLLRFDGTTSVVEALALVSLCDRFVGVDSGLLYTALSLGVPAVGLFTHIEPLSRLARGRGYVALRPTGLDCIPCGDFDGGPVCAGTDRYLACVKAIRAAAVWKAVQAVRPGEAEVRTVPVNRGQLHRPPRARPHLTFVVPWLKPAGGERHLQYLCEGLHPEFEIDLVVTSPEESRPFDGVFDRWSVLNLEGDTRARIRKLAAHLNGTRPQVLAFYNNCLALDALYRCDHRPDKVLAIIHTQFEHEADLTSHSMSFLVDRFVCVSETVREVLRSRTSVDPDRLIVVPNGVELERFEEALSARSELGYGPDDFVLGNVGRIDEGKNLLLLLEACALLPERVKLLFVGWGPHVDLCEARARELGIEDRFRIVGATPDVAPYLRAMDAFALPTDIEGSVPYAVMEAMAAGVPVLCTPVTDVPRLFRDGESILFIERTAESIAEKVRLLLDDAALGKTLADGARVVLRQHLSAEEMLERYMRLLDGERIGGRP
jgi:ADP-heptose:LPS heptosyltransferase